MMQPYVGQIVLYVTRPGQAHAGQNELAAIITRVRPSQSVSIEREQEFKRIVKERKPDADGNMKEFTREVAEMRLVPDTAMAPPSVDLRVFIPDRDDMLRLDRIMPASDKVTGHCWKPIDRDDAADLRAEIADLRKEVAELAAAITEPAPAPKKAASAR